MTRRNFEGLLDSFRNALRQKVEKLDKDREVPDDQFRQIVLDGLESQELVTFLGLAPPPVTGGGQPPPVTGAKSADKRPSSADFDDFMMSLARSMVSTQKRLDLESAAYLAAIENQPHIQPSVFRLPKLEAQMKFGLDIGERTKLNLLFWGKEKETTELNQQGINFEIVAVPAPPGALASARRSIVMWSLVVDPHARERLLAQLEALRTSDSSSNPLLSPLIDAASSKVTDSIAFLDLGDGKRTLALYAQREKDKDIGIWLLTQTDSGPSLEVIYRFTKTLGPEEVLMRDLVLELAAQQEKISGPANG